MNHQKTLNKIVIQQRDDADFPYNVQLHTSVDGGRSWFYCGIGRFCRTLDDARLMRDLLVRNYPNASCREETVQGD